MSAISQNEKERTMIRVAFVIGGYPPEEYKRRADSYGGDAGGLGLETKSCALA
jgi:hypothetical protein